MLLLYYRRMESMGVVSSTPSHWYWLQLENWHCRFMMKPEKYVHIYAKNMSLKSLNWRNIYPRISSTILFLSVVFVPVKSASLCCVWRSRHWPADKRFGERLPPAGGHTRKTGGHDGEGQDWPGLLQVRHSQEENQG